MASSIFYATRLDLDKVEFKVIFEEELNGWHQRESDWPTPRTYETFLAWFEVEVHSMVLDLEGSRLIRTERYD
jgi:hypothetical protein